MEPPVHAPRLGFGLVGRTAEGAEALAPLGPELERLGYDELWVNDGRIRSALDTLAVLARGTTGIDLCVGVTPLDERPAAWIAARVAALELPHERLVLGVGSGGSASLQLVRDGVAELRRLVPGARVAISALGPRMCRLAGEVADVVLLNWTFPDRVRWARDRIAEGAAIAKRPPPRVAGYVRLAVGPDAEDRLAAEAAKYARRPRSYAVLFSEQRAGERGWPGVAVRHPEQASARLEPYRSSLDSCVVRGLPPVDDLDGWLELARAATLRP
jgi:alkanesulfonate monooxygenase SsuD/methylene tetrahydromethanopterin reductase-like flavin-dependent oxidoreductase (luciferase family)